MYTGRLLTSIALAAILHMALAYFLAQLPEQPRLQKVTVEMRVVDPPPSAPEPPPEPEKPKEPEKPLDQPLEKPLEAQQQKPQAMHVTARADKTHDTAKSERAVVTDNSTDVPTFGFSIESTSESGKGPAMPVGNTLQVPSGGPREDKPKALAAPVAARDVTKDPLPKIECHGVYTDEATAAGIEGVVIVSAVIDVDGTTRDIKVVEKLGYGLDAAAIAAVKHCKYTPGEHNGQAVPVRIPRITVRFVLPNAGD